MSETKSNSDHVGRRDFICKSALICSVMSIPLVRDTFAKDKEQKKDWKQSMDFTFIYQCI